jgi:hypothetical protein
LCLGANPFFFNNQPTKEINMSNDNNLKSSITLLDRAMDEDPVLIVGSPLLTIAKEKLNIKGFEDHSAVKRIEFPDESGAVAIFYLNRDKLPGNLSEIVTEEGVQGFWPFKILNYQRLEIIKGESVMITFDTVPEKPGVTLKAV